jgi:hypothetical protein
VFGDNSCERGFTNACRAREQGEFIIQRAFIGVHINIQLIEQIFLTPGSIGVDPLVLGSPTDRRRRGACAQNIPKVPKRGPTALLPIPTFPATPILPAALPLLGIITTTLFFPTPVLFNKITRVISPIITSKETPTSLYWFFDFISL